MWTLDRWWQKVVYVIGWIYAVFIMIWLIGILLLGFSVL
jgi:hypothetical protein